MNSNCEAFETLSEKQYRLLSCFWQEGAEFIVVGGYAVRYHGRLRDADDLDLLVNCSSENIFRLIRVLKSLQAQKLDRARDLFESTQPAVVRWKDSDLLTQTGDLRFQDVRPTALEAQLDGRPMPVMSRIQLVHIKTRASAESRGEKSALDREDVRFLLSKDAG